MTEDTRGHAFSFYKSFQEVATFPAYTSEWKTRKTDGCRLKTRQDDAVSPCALDLFFASIIWLPGERFVQAA